MNRLFFLLSLVLAINAYAILTPSGGSSGNATSLQGTPVSATTPTSSQCLVYSAGSWAPASCGSSGIAGSWISSTGHIVTTNGASTAQDSGTALSSLATTTLNNLGTTQMNANLVFNADSSFTIGNDTGSSGTGIGRPSIIDTARINVPTQCFAENSSTPATCLKRTGGAGTSQLSFNFAGVDQLILSNGTFQVGATAGSEDLVIQGDYSSLPTNVTMTTSGSTTIPNHRNFLILHASGTISAYTITMPAAPLDGQPVTITSDSTITTLTLTPNSGQSIVSAPVTLVVGNSIRYVWSASFSEWMPN